MGELVQVDFNGLKQDNSDNIVFKNDIDTADESSLSLKIDSSYKKKIEEEIYKKTLKRIKNNFRRSRDLKKEKTYMIIKRLFDISVAGTSIAVLSPFFAGLGIMIMLSDGGQPIFSQSRLGKNGKKLRIYKFRSMRMDAEDLKKILTPNQLKQFYAEYKIDNDPRITKIGKFIRKTSIDELPQLFNILDGDMSLIGPRPIVKDEASNYKNRDLKKLLSVKPGLTGYWQAYARNNATYSDGLRQNMELYYADNHCLFLDVKIFVKTIISVLKQEGAQ